MGFGLTKIGGIIWYTDGSKVHEDTGARVLQGRGLTSALGYTPLHSRQKYMA
jgi:hypothetical protein